MREVWIPLRAWWRKTTWLGRASVILAVLAAISGIAGTALVERGYLVAKYFLVAFWILSVVAMFGFTASSWQRRRR